MNEIIKNIEAAQLKAEVPAFNTGDTVIHQNAAPYPAGWSFPAGPQWALLLLVLPFYLMHLSIYQKEGMPQNKTTLRQPPNLLSKSIRRSLLFFRHAVCLQQIYGQLSELHHDIPVPAHLSYRSHLS